MRSSREEDKWFPSDGGGTEGDAGMAEDGRPLNFQAQVTENGKGRGEGYNLAGWVDGSRG